MKDFPDPRRRLRRRLAAAGRTSSSTTCRCPGPSPCARPIPPEDAAPTDLAAAAAVVEQLLESMKRHRPGEPERRASR